MPLSKALYHTCFIRGQGCKWWSRCLKLTSSVISNVKPNIYIYIFYSHASMQQAVYQVQYQVQTGLSKTETLRPEINKLEKNSGESSIRTIGLQETKGENCVDILEAVLAEESKTSTMQGPRYSLVDRASNWQLKKVCSNPACAFEQGTSSHLLHLWTGMQIEVPLTETDFVSDYRH